MSGIAGIARRYPTGVAVESIGRMAAAIKHRGPDGYGFYVGQTVGFAHVRLSVVDVAGGVQPLANEDGRVVITYSGEVYNHRELRLELERRGHIFRTRSDSEVLVHGYEEWGAELLHRLDGQFAFAIYDRNREIVFVARDRFGVRPLFYAQRSGDFYFGSEIKAILASGEVEPDLDRRGLDEVLTFGAARPPRTPFSGIASLEPGTYAIWKDGALWLRHYYELDYPEAGEEPTDVIEQLDEIMLRSVGMRLRADVPVGSHVDGGLNSSIVASLSASASQHTLQTFSMTVGDSPSERGVLQRGAAHPAESVHAISIRRETVADSFPDVVRHAETPLLSSAPALMYHLARVTKESGIKVVLRGDGADELFLGSDVFKEMSVREFCARQPQSQWRHQLFGRVHPELLESGQARDFWHSCLRGGAASDPLFSHLPRFVNSTVRDCYIPEFTAGLAGIDVIAELRASLPTRFFAWSSLNRAAYLEMTTFLSSQLLSSQGDRAAMAHGVELRYPFLDHRVFEFASSLPTSSRLQGLKGKEVLRRWASRVLPSGVARRPKVSLATGPDLFAPGLPGWIADHITPEAIERVGIFSPSAVNRLVRRHQAGLGTGYRDHEAVLGVVSTQLWHHQFIQTKPTIEPLPTSRASVILGDEIPVFSLSDLAQRANQSS
jgi:asparagine synthase (glutamine-hydrolysing)